MEKPTLREALTQLLNGEVRSIRLPEILNYTEITEGRLDSCRVIVVDPIPQTEEVDVVRWMNVHDKGIRTEQEMEEYGYPCDNRSWIKLIGHYTREVKPKVKRREEIEFNIKLIEAMICDGKRIPISAKFYAEWTEESP
jgi:hypothetical protein